MEREAALKLMRALVDSGFIADDQRMDAAIEKVGLDAGLNREQLKAACKYAIEKGLDCRGKQSGMERRNSSWRGSGGPAIAVSLKRAGTEPPAMPGHLS
jgi:hypothetical protein